MNDFSDVSALAPEAHVTTDQLARNKSVLMSGIAAKKSRERRVYYTWGIAAAASVAVATVLVLTVLRPIEPEPLAVAPTATASATPKPTPSPTAAPQPVPTPTPIETMAPPSLGSMMATAATNAESAEVPLGMFRQYTYTLERIQYGGANDLDLDNVTVAYSRSFTYDLFASGQSSDWVMALRDYTDITQYWGDAAALPAPWAPELDTYRQVFPGAYELHSIVMPEEYAEMPRDPQELADYLVAAYDTSAAMVAFMTLTFNTAPADLRSALFEAAALLPDVALVGVIGHNATLEYVPAGEPQKLFRIIVDVSQGDVTTLEWWFARSDVDKTGLPSEVPNTRYTVTNKGLVDTLP